MIKTEEIINQIKEKNDNKNSQIKFTNNYFIDVEPLSVLINDRLKHLNMKPAKLLYISNMDQKNGYKYLNNKKKINRDLAIKLLFVLQYSYEEIQDILKQHGYAPLYAKIKRDNIIINSIICQDSLDTLNEILSINNEELLY